MQKKQNREGCAAFTLIEMMVVVAIIGILIAGVFKLLSAAGANNQRADTVSKIERLQNALSGFYSEYGTYPPVGQYTLPDPFASQTDDYGDAVDGSKLNEEACRLACRSQPLAFEGPYVESLDAYINARFNGRLMSVNTVLGNLNWETKAEYKWCDPENTDNEVKLFKFGALSFLLPRVEVMCSGSLMDSGSDCPKIEFFKSKQWKVNNTQAKVTAKDDTGVRRALEAQRVRENQAMARWLPNFEGIIIGGKNNLLGIDTADHDNVYPRFSADYNIGKGYSSKAGSDYVLATMTIHDGWGHELYYYSAPPYQSYRIWSAGGDNKTFPPWIPLNSISSSADRLTISGWIADDIVRFDH